MEAVRFNKEGDFQVTIKEAVIALATKDPAPGKYDVCLLVEHVDPSGDVYADYWKQQYSSNFCTWKNKEHRTWAEVTLEKLQQVGFSGDFSKLAEELVGVITTATVGEYNGKYYVNFIGGSKPFKPESVAVDANLAAQLNAMANPNGVAPAAQPAAPMPQAPAPAPQMPAQPAAPAMPQAPAPVAQAPQMPQAPAPQAPPMPQAPSPTAQ